MSDVVKWGLLVAGAILIIALILALPFNFRQNNRWKSK